LACRPGPRDAGPQQNGVSTPSLPLLPEGPRFPHALGGRWAPGAPPSHSAGRPPFIIAPFLLHYITVYEGGRAVFSGFVGAVPSSYLDISLRPATPFSEAMPFDDQEESPPMPPGREVPTWEQPLPLMFSELLLRALRPALLRGQFSPLGRPGACVRATDFPEHQPVGSPANPRVRRNKMASFPLGIGGVRAFCSLSVPGRQLFPWN